MHYSACCNLDLAAQPSSSDGVMTGYVAEALPPPPHRGDAVPAARHHHGRLRRLAADAGGPAGVDRRRAQPEQPGDRRRGEGPLGPRPEHPGAVRQVHEERAARRPRHVVHDPPAGAQRPVGPPAGDARADAVRPVHRRRRRGRARRPRGAQAQHGRRPRRPVLRPARLVAAGVLGRAARCCTSSTPGSTGCPGPGRLDPRATPPARITGFYTIDSLLHGDIGAFWDARAPPDPAGLRARLGRGRHRLAPRARQPARRVLDGVRARRPGDGPPRAHGRQPARAAQRAAADDHDRRLLLRLPDHRRGARPRPCSPGPASAATRSRRRASSTSRRSSASPSSAASRSCSPTSSPTSPTPFADPRIRLS